MNATQLLAHFDRLAEAPNAVPRLRRFILDLAVLGKLVEQDAGDEPASELLKRILTTRLQFLKKSVNSNATAVTEIDCTDIELPTGWAWSKLGDLCTKTGSGSTPSGGKDAYVLSGVPFLRSQNVYDEGLRLDGVAFISESTQERMSSTTVKPGDLLLNITGGSIGRCAVVPDSFVLGNINQHVAIIRLALLESGRFLHSVICSDYFQKHILGNQTGAGREGLPKNRMDEILIPVPPLAEQHRIVSKVDELMALCDQLEAAQQERERRRDRLAAASLQRLNQPTLDAAPEAQREHARFHLHHLPSLTTRPELIKAIRKTLLNLAVKGRFASQNSDDEPGVVLLKRLHKARDSLVTAKRLRASKDALPVEAVELPFDLPAGWVRTRLGQVYDVRDGTHDTPKYVDVGYPLITSKNLSSGGLTFQDVKLISEADHRQISERSAVARNDVLLAMIGSIGNPVIVDTDRPFSIKNVALFKCFDMELSSPRFLCLYLQHATDVMRDLATGGLQPFVSLGFLRNFPVALPPLAEQHRIVAKVDELMALCDQLEAQLTTTQTNSRRLLEAVLEEALIPVT